MSKTTNDASSGGKGVLRNERGAVLALVAVVMVGLLGMVGLALDSARAYIARAQLSRAVDAAALAGAASLRLGQGTADQRVRSLAAANGVTSPDATLDVVFGQNDEGESTVTVTAGRTVPTTFMRVLGRNSVDVSSTAQATVPPLDIVLVLDTSGSLSQQGAWDDLQDAAKNFVDNFDDSIDQMGLVSFQIVGANRVMLDQPFKTTVRTTIDALTSAGDTNMGEGLRYAGEQLQGPSVRDRSLRVVVFFTDGRPTAFREPLGGEDRVMAVYTTTNPIRGYFDNPDLLNPNLLANPPNGCINQPSCFSYSEKKARDRARYWGLQRAEEIRSQGIYIFSIGLGNPKAKDKLERPDDAYLRAIANEDGKTNGSQPRGSYYFAPTAAELDGVFDAVAQDILVRLTQ